MLPKLFQNFFHHTFNFSLTKRKDFQPYLHFYIINEKIFSQYYSFISSEFRVTLGLSCNNSNLLWGNQQIQHLTKNPTYFASCQRPENFTSCSVRWPHSLIRVNSEIAGGRDKVKCAFCSLRLIYWDPKDIPKKEHRRFKPDCPFLGGVVANAGTVIFFWTTYLFCFYL